MQFGWKVLKHIKSNAILIAKDGVTIGVGAGQVSRLDAVNIALKKSGSDIQGSILCSDGFFPFRDSIDMIAYSGIEAVIQPGGSLRDEEVIDACNDHGVSMVFTGQRCFKH
jgi:phosphoribosylaminoimidazolecarboxamide formyltransferase/IMP cyclohydrolase